MRINKKNTTKDSNDGYSILELLFYLSIFAILTLAVINAMIIMARSFRETVVQAELMSVNSVMERISREIRQASDINSITDNDLVLNTKDQIGTAKTVEFLLSGSNLNFLENGILVGNLNPPNISIMALTFSQIITNNGKAVKVFLTIKSNNDKSNRNENFYNTVVLRGNY